MLITPAEIIGGTLSYTIIHGIVWGCKKVLSFGWQKTERALAIHHHYHMRALKKGHSASSVLDCYESKCALF